MFIVVIIAFVSPYVLVIASYFYKKYMLNVILMKYFLMLIRTNILICRLNIIMIIVWKGC